LVFLRKKLINDIFVDIRVAGKQGCRT
jgi:hypothetical protein